MMPMPMLDQKLPEDELASLTAIEAETRDRVATLDRELADLCERRGELTLDVRLNRAGADDLAALYEKIAAVERERIVGLDALRGIDTRRRQAVTAKRQAIVGELDRILVDLVEQRDAVIARLDADRRYHAHHGVNPAHPDDHECLPPTVFDHALRLEAQVFALAHDLFGLTREARYRSMLTLPVSREQVGTEKRFPLGPVATPWRHLLEPLNLEVPS